MAFQFPPCQNQIYNSIIIIVNTSMPSTHFAPRNSFDIFHDLTISHYLYNLIFHYLNIQV